MINLFKKFTSRFGGKKTFKLVRQFSKRNPKAAYEELNDDKCDEVFDALGLGELKNLEEIDEKSFEEAFQKVQNFSSGDATEALQQTILDVIGDSSEFGKHLTDLKDTAGDFNDTNPETKQFMSELRDMVDKEGEEEHTTTTPYLHDQDSEEVQW